MWPSRTLSTPLMRLSHTPTGEPVAQILVITNILTAGLTCRDSTPFREWYNIPEAETVVRGTLRYQGFPAFIKALVEIGFLDDSKKDYLSEGSEIQWAAVTAKAVGAASADEA